jgi:DNA (cytosine-5)-methyltransferase 1
MAQKRRPTTRANEGREKATIIRVAQKKDFALFTTVDRSRLMARVRQANTSNEMAVRQLVHSLGFRFRVNGKGLPGRPDLVNRKSHWAILVHGCYWHAHEGCRLWKIPAHNRPFWEKKFTDNRRRDRRKLKELENLGYRVLVIWQCELADMDRLAVRLLDFLEDRKVGGFSENFRLISRNRRVVRTVTSDSKAATTLQEVPYELEDNEDSHSVFDRAFLRNAYRVLPELSGTPVRCADLFCGCGGLSLGIREACWAVGRPFTAVLSVDHDPWALKVYKDNFSPLQTSEEDLDKLLDGKFGKPPSKGERDWLENIGPLDILVAGPPCQGNSDLNNQTRRTDPRNRLYEKVARFVELTRPTHVLIENVPGVVHDSEGVLSRTAGHLEDFGYKVEEGIVDLTRLGVPQKRRRHVLAASLSGLVCIETILKRHEVPSRSVAWAIRDLENRTAEGLLDTASRPSRENLDRIYYLLENDELNLPNAMRPACHQNDDHSYKSMYGRLSWTEPAQTITSGFGSPGQGRFIHPSQPRVLTPREAARLQFFPDSFSFSEVEKRGRLAQLIGNAVPMKLSYAFALAFLTG